jgi:L-alanine-DL-glutamate epimerase-like enolase superfamily enzyme
MEAHMTIVADRARAAYAETLDATVKIQVFGQPSVAMLAALREQAGSGVEITLHPESRWLHSGCQRGLTSPRRWSAHLEDSRS